MSVKLNFGKVFFSSNGVQWIIPNFYELPQEPDSVITSPRFRYVGVDWKLLVYPNGHTRFSSSDWFGITASICDLRTRAGIVRLGIIGEPKINFIKSRAESHGKGLYRCMRLFPVSFLESWKNQMVPEGNLHVFFSVEKESDTLTAHSSIQVGAENGKLEKRCEKELALTRIDASTQTEEGLGITKLQEDFKEMLLNGHASDVVLNVNGQTFRGHSCVLTSRCPILMSFVKRHTKDKDTDIVDLPNIDSNIFSEFLNYLYTGSVENLTPESAPKLYAFADKYHVDHLKQSCLVYMLVNITTENFCDVLTLSLQHNETKLKENCVKYFAKKSLDIITTNKWQAFLCKNPVLGNKLFIKHLQLNKQT